MMGPAMPQPRSSGFFSPVSGVGPTPVHLIATASSLRLGRFLRRRFISHHLLLQSSIEDFWFENSSRLRRINILNPSQGYLSAAASSWCVWFFRGDGNRNRNNSVGKSNSDSQRRVPSSGRGWTNVLLIVNVLVYIAQIATRGKLLLWGAKINNLIDGGQLWRLATSSLLHANIGHLMVNCYSLNSIGPAVEGITGPRRYLAVYFTSAIAKFRENQVRQ